jgi:peptidoglycan/LPS O-acetylase OafA/YrhL
MQLLARFMNFASGIIGGLLVIQYPRSKWINDKWLNSLLGVVGIVIFGFAVFSNQFNILNGLNEYLAVCLNYFLTFGVSGTLIILSLYGNSWLRKVFENKVMVYGGKISFAFYLIHIHVFTYLKDPLLAVIESITGKGINRLPANILVVFVIFLVTGLLSAFIYERIERPVQTYLRSLWLQEKRYQPKPSF